jgi:hypothetical protein
MRHRWNREAFKPSSLDTAKTPFIWASPLACRGVQDHWCTSDRLTEGKGCGNVADYT